MNTLMKNGKSFSLVVELLAEKKEMSSARIINVR